MLIFGFSLTNFHNETTNPEYRTSDGCVCVCVVYVQKSRYADAEVIRNCHVKKCVGYNFCTQYLTPKHWSYPDFVVLDPLDSERNHILHAPAASAVIYSGRKFSYLCWFLFCVRSFVFLFLRVCWCYKALFSNNNLRIAVMYSPAACSTRTTGTRCSCFHTENR